MDHFGDCKVVIKAIFTSWELFIVGFCYRFNGFFFVVFNAVLEVLWAVLVLNLEAILAIAKLLSWFTTHYGDIKVISRFFQGFSDHFGDIHHNLAQPGG